MHSPLITVLNVVDALTSYYCLKCSWCIHLLLLFLIFCIFFHPSIVLCIIFLLSCFCWTRSSSLCLQILISLFSFVLSLFHYIYTCRPHILLLSYIFLFSTLSCIDPTGLKTWIKNRSLELPKVDVLKLVESALQHTAWISGWESRFVETKMMFRKDHQLNRWFATCKSSV